MRRRRKSDPAEEPDVEETVESSDEADLSGRPPGGPFDDSEVDLEEGTLVDLGSLLVSPGPDMEIRLQVDERQEVIAAVLLNDQGALELRAFAAARNGAAWDELRPQITAETARLGGTASERTGPFGAELYCEVPVEVPEGPAVQPSRIIGHEGPRWLLRATLMGAPATDRSAAEPWEDTIRRTVVRRGRDAMAPGAPLPLRLPPEARRID